MSIIRVTFFALALIALSNALKGVNPIETQKYNSNSGFTCGNGKKIPSSYVNDDYCDCEDGSDEPGTAACTMIEGVPKKSFYCENKGFKAKKIFSSYVNDGVCDCCDGSDEAAGVCHNTCNHEGREILKNLKIKFQSYQAGLKSRQEAIKTAIRDIKNLRQSLKTKKEKQEAQAKKVAKIKQEKERLEKQEEIEKNLLRESIEMEKGENKGTSPIEEVPETNTDTTSAPENTSEGKENTKKTIKKWNEKGELVEIEVDENNNEVKEDPTIDTTPLEKPDQPNEEAANNDEPEEVKNFKLEEAEKVRNKYQNEKKALDSLDTEIQSIEKTLAGNYGEHNQFYSLRTQCHKLVDKAYEYELCHFSNVRQKEQKNHGSTTLGSFVSFDQNDTVMQYKNGQGCWQGPSRSTKVTLVCGQESKILKVDEPSRCVYEMIFQTNGACTEADIKNISEQIAELER